MTRPRWSWTSSIGLLTAALLITPMAKSQNGGTTLQPNQQLNVNDQLTLPNGRVHLIMQADGNLVLYTADGHPLWASNTWGTPANHAIMQTDGNFVVYDANGHAYWSTGTWGRPGSYLVLQDSGNLVVYSTGETILWQSNTAQNWNFPDRLTANQQLNVNDQLFSGNGNYHLIMQADGNLVLYTTNGHPLWASNTWGQPANHAIMQGDGNFVLYDAGGKPYWSSNTWGYPGAYVVLQNDGNLVVYSAGNVALWASNTVQPSNVAPVFPITASRDDNFPGSGGFMHTDVTIYASGLLNAVTHTWEVTDLRGFKGDVAVALLDQNQNVIYVTPTQSYGVDGRWIGTSDRWDNWSANIPPDILQSVRYIAIIQKWDPDVVGDIEHWLAGLGVVASGVGGILSAIPLAAL